MHQATARQLVELPPAGTYRFDPNHTSVAFVGRHLMITKVRGTFRAFDGTVEIADAPERSGVTVEIDAASLDTGLAMRDDHLRSPDFLDVEAHPTITFRSTRVELTGSDTFDLHGDLTIRDTTKPVTLHASYSGTGSMDGDVRAGFDAYADIDREDWGMTWNQALEAGGFMVSKKVRIELVVQLVKTD